MQNSLCPRTFLTTNPTEIPLGSPGIVVAGPDLSGRSNLREAGRSWATGLPYQLSSPSTGEGQGKDEPGKAHLKSKMRWN